MPPAKRNSLRYLPWRPTTYSVRSTKRTRALADAFDPSGDHIIVHKDGAIGRIWVDSTGLDWELVDLAILPEYQDRGIATVLLDDLIRQSEHLGATVGLTVRSDNLGAQRLYFRHGFRVVATTESDLRLVRNPTWQRHERFERLRERVLADVTLQVSLRSVPNDQFTDRIVEVARSLELELDADDVREAQRTARSDWLTRWV